MATPPTFSAGAVLTAAQMNKVGMWLISETSLSGVTTNINNVFSSDYENYRIVLSQLNNGSGSTRPVIIRLRTTSDDTSANYFYTQYYIFGAGATASPVSFVTATSAGIFNIAQGTAGGSCTFDMCGPNTATITTYVGQAWTYQSDVAAYVYRSIGGCVNTTTAYTGFSIIGSTDALSGKVRVYGYRNG